MKFKNYFFQVAAHFNELTFELERKIQEVVTTVSRLQTVNPEIHEHLQIIESNIQKHETVNLEFREQLESKSNQEDTFDDIIQNFASGSLSVERNRGIASPCSLKFRYSFDFGDDEGLFRNSRSLPPTSVEKTPNIFQDMNEVWERKLLFVFNPRMSQCVSDY